ncbi:pseudouridine synthase [Candidatus Bathyarchaeota archaeon]|nr:MAG: pseudouridine synthase [Candidatus Bathyarchaeota archaeon]
MDPEVQRELDLKRLRAIADYQFGPGAGEALFPDDVEVIRGRTGRIKHVRCKGLLLATLRASDGLFSLTIHGAKRLEGFLGDRHKVVVSEEAAPFVARGRSVFAKHVLRADPDIRPGDEVLVVGPDGRLLAVGKALLTGREMLFFRRGVAVKVRAGSAES